MSEETCLEFTTIEKARLRELEAENKQLRGRAEQAEAAIMAVLDLEPDIKRLRSLLHAIDRVLKGTGHNILVDERGRYYLHSADCDHYPLPPVMKGDEVQE